MIEEVEEVETAVETVVKEEIEEILKEETLKEETTKKQTIKEDIPSASEEKKMLYVTRTFLEKINLPASKTT